MRKKFSEVSMEYKILVVDDEIGIINSLKVMLNRYGYYCDGITNPIEALEVLEKEKYDMLILDFIMSPIHGDEVVSRLRKFNQDLYVLLLTGHKDMAPPLETIKVLDIQGYCEKNDRFDQLLLLIESGIKSIKQIRTIHQFKEGLNKILNTVPKIYQLQPIGVILEEILVGLLPIVNSSNAFILIDDFHSNGDTIFKGVGDYDIPVELLLSMLSPALIENIGYSRKNKEVVKNDIGIILPLANVDGSSLGVIYIESNQLDENEKLVEIYANQAASSINNAFLHSLINIKKEELDKTFQELRLRYMDTIEALRLTVDAKDFYTRGHSDRVAYYAVKIGEELGLSHDDIELLKLGGVFHDIGKIGTADDILFKTERLDRDEFDEIKKHPLKGAYILSAISMFKEVVPLVMYHHERFDGAGYPQGIKGEEIPLLARILSVADAFDAMTSDRTYRQKLKVEEAITQFQKHSGSQFDPKIVDVLLKIVKDYDIFEKELEYTYL
jgi:putative nucleotidyltransferase with HDIG domain